MKTEPCPRCKREVMRDGTVGLLVCSCGQVLEIPTDLEGPIRPKENDKRWHGTQGEREDMAELGLPEPKLPTKQHDAYEELNQRATENHEKEQSLIDQERELAEAAIKRFLRVPPGAFDG